MSRLHRSASAQMSRPAISIRSDGGWTFGSPSVLMMFHRTAGALESELAEMDECMPHYYKITGGHGRGAELLAVCGGMHYALVALHLRIQTAAAYAQLGKREEARTWLAEALADAAPDGFVMPFVENYDALASLLAEQKDCPLTARIEALGQAARRRLAVENRPPELAALTEREYGIVCLMGQRLSNREIAERLFLSEGSVKQYVNQIYSKLHIDGDTRTKRTRLTELLAKN